MLDKKELENLSKLANTDQTTVMREYLQLLFLSNFYQSNESRHVNFKGGTAIRLIYKGNRFSEDLDFTVNLTESEFSNIFSEIRFKLENNYPIQFKEKKSRQGKNFLLTANPKILSYSVFINLDFSFREKVREPKKSIIKTHFPVIFTDYIYHLSKEEILAEKVRAIYSRKKGRDLYDLWFLLNKGTKIKPKLINHKLAYYKKDLKYYREDLIDKIKNYSKKEFIKDLKPFVIEKDRKKLDQMYDYILDYLDSEIHLDRQ